MDEKQNAQSDLSKSLTKPGIGQLAAAYVGAWGEIDNVVKNSANPHFGSDYADLAAVLDTVRPVFARHGLALLTAPGKVDAAGNLALTWMLVHKSGEFVSGEMSLPIGKPSAQAGGSCTTYMRRYLTAAVGGIAQIDDDGNAASEPPKKAAPKAAKAPAAPADSTYAERKQVLLDKVKGCKDVAALEALKPELASFGDQDLANEYAAHKRSLKGAK